MNKNRIYTETLPQAKKLFKLKTGRDWDNKGTNSNPYGITIFRLKIKRTKTRRYAVCTYLDWLNL